jgi:hypothetical protein
MEMSSPPVVLPSSIGEDSSSQLLSKDSAVLAPNFTPIDVICDFKTIDLDKNGEITAVEFIDGLRSNRQLASKFGLSDDILNESGTREKYELTFGTIDYNHSATVNVLTLLYQYLQICTHVISFSLLDVYS